MLSIERTADKNLSLVECAASVVFHIKRTFRRGRLEVASKHAAPPCGKPLKARLPRCRPWKGRRHSRRSAPCTRALSGFLNARFIWNTTLVIKTLKRPQYYRKKTLKKPAKDKSDSLRSRYTVHHRLRRLTEQSVPPCNLSPGAKVARLGSCELTHS